MSKTFLGYVAATYPFIWVDTIEYQRSIDSLKRTVGKLGHKCYKWDIVTGITDVNSGQVVEQPNDDPTQPVLFLEDGKINNTIIFVQDYHLYLKSEAIWRRMLNNIDRFKESANILVFVSPVVEIPTEIKRYITIMDFELPNKEQLNEMLEDFCKDLDIEIPKGKDKEEIINCGLGLTLFEFENALALSIAKHESIVPSTIHNQKEQLIRKNAALGITKFSGGFETLEGMDNLKAFTKNMVGKGRGVLLLGVPGGGKSHFAKTLGNETGRITIDMDFGKMMGGIVGDTERNTNESLKVIDAMSPCILFVDEIEKGLAGVSGYNGDSGTSKRQGGQFLKWLNDHTSDVYLVATSNNISNLPPEFLRAERWDAIFFIDVPTQREREAILNLYKKQYNVEDDVLPNMENWTGAEIKTLCKLSANLGVPLVEAARYVCPIYKTMEGEITKLREFAINRTVPASGEAFLAPTGTDGATQKVKRNIKKVEE